MVMGWRNLVQNITQRQGLGLKQGVVINPMNYLCLIFLLVISINCHTFFMTSIFIVNESSQPWIFLKNLMRCHGKLILPTTVNVMLSLLWGATLNYGDPLSWHSGMLEDLLQIVERKHGPGMCLVICGLNSSLFNFQWLNLGVTRCWDKSWQMLPNQTSNVQKFRSVKVACCSLVC